MPRTYCLAVLLCCVALGALGQSCPPNTGGDGNTGCGNKGTANTGSYNSGTANTGFCNSGTANTGVGQVGTGQTGCSTTCPAGTLNPNSAVPVPGTPCPAGQTFGLYGVGQYCACLGADGQPAGSVYNPRVNNGQATAAGAAALMQPNAAAATGAAVPARAPAAAAPARAPATAPPARALAQAAAGTARAPAPAANCYCPCLGAQ